jgi:hypothetical protein
MSHKEEWVIKVPKNCHVLFKWLGSYLHMLFSVLLTFKGQIANIKRNLGSISPSVHEQLLHQQIDAKLTVIQRSVQILP